MFNFFDPRWMQAGFQMAEVWRDSAATIAMRMPILAAASQGDTKAAHQTTLMMTEKMTAATEGSMAVTRTVLDYSIKLMAGKLEKADHVSGPLDLWFAASAPARKQVKKNAKRLTRRR
jgi:hypothetical protein